LVDDSSQYAHRQNQHYFEASCVSLKLFAFHCVCNRLLLAICHREEGGGVGAGEVKQALDAHLGAPTAEVVDRLQFACKSIKGMQGWNEFFKAIDVEAPSTADLGKWLADSTRQSKSKGYH
jgi:hypothetical protein